jgi:hypothetical protein
MLATLMSLWPNTWEKQLEGKNNLFQPMVSVYHGGLSMTKQKSLHDYKDVERKNAYCQ